MSTEHNGGYCQFRDKMMLTKEEAMALASRMQGTSHYACVKCGAHHIFTTNVTAQRSVKRRYKARKERPITFSADGEIFEKKTRDYDPNKMVAAVPPEDFTGRMSDWFNALSKMRLPDNYAVGVPMIRNADHCRLVARLEP